MIFQANEIGILCWEGKAHYLNSCDIDMKVTTKINDFLTFSVLTNPVKEDLMNKILKGIDWEALKWNCKQPEVFYLPQWQTEKKIDTSYLVYKFLLNGFYVAVFVTLIIAGTPFPFFIRVKAACYYTYWVFLISALNALASLTSVFRQYRKQRKQPENTEPATGLALFKFQWIVQSIALDSSIAVSLGYFSLEFIYELRSFGTGTSCMHLWNTLLVYMDFYVCSVPAKLLQIYPTVILSALYGLFTYIYYLSGGLGVYEEHYLYKILDYKKRPDLAIVALITVLVYIIIGRITACLSYKLRRKLYYKYYFSDTIDEVMLHNTPVAK